MYIRIYYLSWYLWIFRAIVVMLYEVTDIKKQFVAAVYCGSVCVVDVLIGTVTRYSCVGLCDFNHVIDGIIFSVDFSRLSFGYEFPVFFR